MHQRLAPQRLAPHRESTSLSIGQPQTTTPMLLSEPPAFLKQVLDRQLLPTDDSARRDHDEKLELKHPVMFAREPGSSNITAPPDRQT